MAIQYTEQLFATRYRDDFRDSDHYHRILFNSGRQLQARELTQMQTIIQRELERFGRNIFKEGAAVVPGGMTVNNAYEFVKLNTSSNTLPVNTAAMVGDTFVGQTSGIQAQILQVEPVDGADPATVYVKYTNSLAGTSGATPIRFTPGEDIVGNATSVTLTVQTTNTLGNPAIGKGTIGSVHRGTFFTQGHFVQADNQKIIISKYSPTPTEVVGFIVTQDVVTVDDTTALYDNQGLLPNLTAPGADRYRITLTLALESQIDSADTFVYFGKIRNGVLIEAVTGTEDYNKIRDFNALRTKEINGDFIKQAFKIEFDEHDSDNTKLVMDVSAGVAYVNGYRASKGSPIKLNVDKSLTTTTINSEPIAASYGNYVLSLTFAGLPNVDTFELQNIRNAVTHGGSTIGTCRVKAVEEDGANYRFYLMDIKMNSGQNFRDAKSIGTSADQYFDLILENGIAVQKNTVNNNLLFPFPQERVKSITDVSLTTQRRVTATTDGAGNASLPTLGANEVYSTSTQWIFAAVGGGGATFTPSSITGVGTNSASIAGGPSSTSIEALVHVQKDGILRTKTLTNTTRSTTIITPSSGARYIDLAKADIYDVTRIRAVDSNGADLSNDFILDKGARDNFYETGRLLLKGNAAVPSGNVFVRFNYFTHSPNGHYFAASSYGGINYGNIPIHTLGNGTDIPLYDVLDFRSRKDDTNSNFSAGTARVNEVPINTSLITADTEYYLPRFDKLVIDEQANISLLTGTPSLNPQYPPIPANSLELYNVKFNPGTTDATDLTIQNIEAKGFTMRDIAKLEERIENLEEFTTLSLLENDAASFAVFDSIGNDRTKSGFLVDNFSDHVASDTLNQEYRGAIDPREQMLRPIFNEESINLKYDSSLSTNAILKGDNVYIAHTDALYIDQPLASGTENINPFAVITNRGIINLSPGSDNWKEVVYVANRVINGGTRLDTRQSLLWNNWNWNWQGNRINNLRVGQQLAQTDTGWQRRGRVANRTVTTDTVVRDEIVREQIGDRVVNVALIPFMRSRKVWFKAEGIAPNVRMWAYFDGQRVDNWVRSESFQRMATQPDDYGSRYNNATQHPETPSALYSNAQGEVEGSFFIPNSNAKRFRTGQREFKLMDISANNDDDAISIATAQFTSTGILETRQRDILSTRVITVAGTQRNHRMVFDPLAQSFFVDEDNGIFITKVRVFFQTKDGTVPVSCEIRPMVNGQPSSDTTVPGTVKYLPPSSVNTSSDASVGTDFIFDEPAYLLPFTEYAIVLKAESTRYNVFIAETEQFVLGSTAKKVSKQPTLGSLFKSQNASTWEPAQTKDLMFQIYKANFNTAGATVVLENSNVPQQLLTTNPLTVAGSSKVVTVIQANHGFDSGDIVTFAGLDSATNYGGGILGTDILGNRNVIAHDENSFRFNAGATNASSNPFSFGGTDVRASRNYMFETVVPFIENLVPQSTNLNIKGKFTSGKSLAGSETPYLKDTIDTELDMRENNSFSVVKMVANRGQEVSEMSGSRSATVTVALSTTDPNVSPVLDMQRSSLWMIHNNIDFQDSAGSLGILSGNRNLPINYADETDPTGGSHVAKHIVRPVTLENAAIGLKVLIGANVPQEAAFDLYYKAVEEDVAFEDTNWVYIAPENNLPTDENPNVFREYEYLIGGQSGLSNAFTKFTLKIVMKSTNAAKVPTFRDLRIIALAV